MGFVTASNVQRIYEVGAQKVAHMLISTKKTFFSESHNFALRQYFLARFFLYHICSSRNVHFWGFWVTKCVVALVGEGDTWSQIRNLTQIPNSDIWDLSQISDLGSDFTLPKHHHHAFCHSKTSEMNVSWWGDVVQKKSCQKILSECKVMTLRKISFFFPLISIWAIFWGSTS